MIDITISENTLRAVGKALRIAVADLQNDMAIAAVALEAFGECASPKDWDELERLKP